MITGFIRICLFVIMMLLQPFVLLWINSKKEDEPYGKSHGRLIRNPDDWIWLKLLGDMFWNEAQYWVAGNVDAYAKPWYILLLDGSLSVIYFTDKDGIRHVFKPHPDKENRLLMENYEKVGDKWEIIGTMEVSSWQELARKPECGLYVGMIMWIVKKEDYNGK